MDGRVVVAGRDVLQRMGEREEISRDACAVVSVLCWARKSQDKRDEAGGRPAGSSSLSCRWFSQ